MTFWDWFDAQPQWVRVAIPTVGFLLIVVLGIWVFASLGWGDWSG